MPVLDLMPLWFFINALFYLDNIVLDMVDGRMEWLRMYVARSYKQRYHEAIFHPSKVGSVENALELMVRHSSLSSSVPFHLN